MVQPRASDDFRRTFFFVLLIASAVMVRAGFVGSGNWYYGLIVTIPLMIALAVKPARQPRKTYHRVGHRPLMKRA